MCDDPGCTLHAGPIMDPVEGKIRHCDTAVLLNSECPYLELGCLGCTLNCPIGVSVFEELTPTVPADSTQKPSWDDEPILEGAGIAVETCDCGQPFPANGYCPFCGAHQRHPGE
jgi:hypothetical protein